MVKAVIIDFASMGSDLNLEGLQSVCDHLVIYQHTQNEDLYERTKDFDCVICNKVGMDRQLMESLPALKLICVLATGLDHIDLDAAKDLGIVVKNVEGYAASIVSQYCMAMILWFAQRLDHYTRVSRNGTWVKSKTFCVLNHEMTDVAGKKLVLLGRGSIAKSLSEKAIAFGMEVSFAAVPNYKHSQKGEFLLDFDRALKDADFISLHCPLSFHTRELINAQRLKRMKPSSFLINSSRGAVIDENALAVALRTGEIAGAALDVLSTEPPSADHPLLAKDLPNLILTPHIAWASLSARSKILEVTAQHIKNFCEKK